MRNQYRIKYKGKQYPRESHQSVLDCLLSHGLKIPHSCRSGVCCSCMMKGSVSNIPNVAQNGLKDTLKEQGYFLSCVYKPEEDLEIFDADSSVQTQGQVIDLDFLNTEVMRLCLQVPRSFTFKAGQYLSLIRNDGLMRSYSIASLPETGQVELHIRIIPNGSMSLWVKNSLNRGDAIGIRGPFGNCYYSISNKEQPLVLIGTGTGLAPLYGILKDAILQGHLGPIDLFHGGVNPSSLYLIEDLREISRKKSQFQYHPCVLTSGTDTIPEIALDQYILKKVSWLKSARIYLCGDPSLVTTLRKKLFIAGASSREIYADAFLPSMV